MTNLTDLPHKTAYEACNPDHTLISEVQVAEDEGIKIQTLRQYSHASIKAAVGTRLDPVCKDEAGIRWYTGEDVAAWKGKRAETKARCRNHMQLPYRRR
ncbi:hypothetical protein [Rothia mucilaginosa]|uniref:hypothetical protein n=1 Tax=Rothia mucilaginosa TaxID=43675 RepID=UPI0026F1BA5D|nr:hypothetical protein [Rothia mucilaginosa]